MNGFRKWNEVDSNYTTSDNFIWKKFVYVDLKPEFNRNNKCSIE